MKRGAFIKLCGSSVFHVTAAQNASNIRARGLMPAAALATIAGVDPERIALRNERRTIVGTTTLNHQKPLRMGRGKESTFLEGHSLKSWAMQLDCRVFFAPHKKLDALQGSFDVETTTFEIDSGTLFDALKEHVWLSPINSGNADRRPVLRGDWIYAPATAAPDAFRRNRVNRGLVKKADRVQEISLTCAIGPQLLKSMLV